VGHRAGLDAVVKVKLSLCLTEHHIMTTHGGLNVQFHAFLISALDGGKWSASCSGPFTQGKRALGTVGLKAPKSK
jgi:hypothetical protein